jgi:hypothetical protein
MDEQKATLEAEVRKMQESQNILDKRMAEIKAKAEEDKERARKAQEEWERKQREADERRTREEAARQRAIQAAEQQRKHHSDGRAAKRVLGGIIGGIAIIATGGIAAPLVAAAAVGMEASNQDQKKADNAYLNRAYNS